MPVAERGSVDTYSRLLQNPCLQAWHGQLARVLWAGRHGGRPSIIENSGTGSLPVSYGPDDTEVSIIANKGNAMELEGRAPSRPEADAKLRIAGKGYWNGQAQVFHAIIIEFWGMY